MAKTTTGTNLEQESYLKLEQSCSGCEEILTEAAAKILINKEFGFEASRIRIYTEVKTYENVGGRLVGKDTYTRKPLYASTDWNYIRFNVAGFQYEMIDGSLYFYYD